MDTLTHDLEFQSTTFVVIDFETTTPRGHSPEPIEVAAVGLRHHAGAWSRTAAFSALMKPPEHAPVTPFDTNQTGITPAMVAHQPPAGQILAQLDARLIHPPYLLVAHHAPVEAALIYAHRASCPTLATIPLLDTVRLARRLLPALPSYGLDALINHLHIPRPPDRHRAMPDVEVTITLLRHLIDTARATGELGTLRAVMSAAGLTAKATGPTQEPIF
jgi:DNA polymerase III subunit epsilon